MTASLPHEVQAVFDRFITTEYTTVDRRGQPITWPVTPYYRRGQECIDVTTGLGYPKKADDAAANTKVGLLFSDPTGCRMDDPPIVLVQGTAGVDDRNLEENRERYDTAVLSIVAPDGFPFSVRLPVTVDRDGRRIRIGRAPAGAPLQRGLACLTAHDHAPDFAWQRNFQVRGDLVEDEGGWSLMPAKLGGGFELPPTGALERYRLNFSKIMRFRRIAKRELTKRA